MLCGYQQFAEEKAYHKAEQIHGDEAFPQDHQACDQSGLEQIGPGTKGEKGHTSEKA